MAGLTNITDAIGGIIGSIIGGPAGAAVGREVGDVVGSIADGATSAPAAPDAGPTPAPAPAPVGKPLIQSKTAWINVAIAAGTALLSWGASYDWTTLIGPSGSIALIAGLNIVLRWVTARPIGPG